MSESMRLKVNELLLEGKGNAFISKILDIDVDVIEGYMNSLTKPRSQYYDPALFLKIKAVRDLQKQAKLQELEERKQKIYLILDYLNQGYSFFEIALLLKTTETEIYQLLDKVHGLLDPQLKDAHQKIIQIKMDSDRYFYRNMKKIENLMKNGVPIQEVLASKTLSDYNKYLKYLKVIELLKQYEFVISPGDLSRGSHLSLSDVKRFLNGERYSEIFTSAFGDDGWEKLKIGQEKVSSIPKAKPTIQLPQNPYKEEKEKFYQVEDNIAFWFQIIFTFHLSISEFARLVDIQNISELKNLLVRKSYDYPNYHDVLLFLFSEGVSVNEEEREKRFQAAKMFVASGKKEDLYRNLLREDIKAKRLLSKERHLLTEEDWASIIRFRIKYVLPYRALQIDPRTVESHMIESLKKENEAVSSYIVQKSVSDRSRYAKKEVKMASLANPTYEEIKRGR